MRFSFELKPTSHESYCVSCRKPILKDEPCLKGEQFMYPGTRQGRLCFVCLRIQFKKLEKQYRKWYRKGLYKQTGGNTDENNKNQ